MNTKEIDFIFTGGIDCGFTKLFEGTPAEVIERFRERVAGMTQYPVYRIVLGYAYYANGMTEEAIKEYQEAMRLAQYKGHYYRVSCLLGNIYYDSMQFDSAKSSYNYYLENEPGDLEYLPLAYAAYKRVKEIEGKPIYNLNDKGTLAKPIKIHAPNEFIGIQAEYDYLNDKYFIRHSGWAVIGRETCVESTGTFDKFIIGSDNVSREVYFDISEFIGNSKMVD